MIAIAFLIKKNCLIELRTWKWFFLEALIIIVLYATALMRFERIAERIVEYTEETAKTLQFSKPTTDLLYLPLKPQLRGLYISYSQRNDRRVRELIEGMTYNLKLPKSRGYATTELLNIYFDETKSLASLDVAGYYHGITIRFPAQFRTIDLNKVSVCNRYWVTCLGLKENNTIYDAYFHEGYLHIRHNYFVEFDLRYYRRRQVYYVSFGPASNWEPESNPCFESNIGFIYWFTYLVPFVVLIKKFLPERENNITGHFLIYGFHYLEHWIAHFVVSLVHLTMLNLIILYFLWVPWENTPWSFFTATFHPVCLFLFLMMSSILIFTYARIIASLIPKTYAAQLTAIAMWLFAYGSFFIFLNESKGELNYLKYIFIIIFPNVYYPYAVSRLLFSQKQEKVPEIIVLSFFLLALHLLLLLLLHVKSAIFQDHEVENEFQGNPEADFSNNVEKDPPLRNMLEMRNVSTFFDRKKSPSTSLKNISMRFFENEITVIFGTRNNGSTRLLNILSGTDSNYENSIVFQENIDIRKNRSSYRKNVDAMLTDANPFFDQLTVYEHLKYFIDLKQNKMNKKKKSMELKKWLNILKPFISAERILVQHLNYSQKRLLYLSCTLCCGTKIILLNEPTQHMPNSERFWFWHILKQEKYSRTIILTTVDADETEKLADRIAFLEQGQLLAYGNKYFLKNTFSKYYKLVVFIEPMKPIIDITAMLKHIGTPAIIHSHFADRVIYYLPEEKRSLYQKLLLNLENNFEKLGITQILVQGAELIDAYTVATTKEQQPTLEKSLPSPAKESLDDIFKKINGQKFISQDFFAVIYKKIISPATYLLVPSILLFITLLIIYFHESLTAQTVSETLGSKQYVGFTWHNASRYHILNCQYWELISMPYVFYENHPLQFSYSDRNIKCGKQPFPEARKSYGGNSFGAVERLGELSFNMFVNEGFFHSGLITLNLAHNFIHQQLFENYTSTTHMFTQPLQPAVNLRDNFEEHKITSLRLPVLLGAVMPLTISAIIVPLIEEQQSHMLTLQRLSGIAIDLLWCIHFIWDFAMICLIQLIYYIVLNLFVIRANIVFLTVFILYGFSLLAFNYLLALFIQPKWKRFWVSGIIQIGLGPCAYVTYLDNFNSDQYIFNTMLLISPPFAFMEALALLYTDQIVQNHCTRDCKYVGCNDICDLRTACCDKNLFLMSSGMFLPAKYLAISCFIWTIAFLCIYKCDLKLLCSLLKNNIKSWLSFKLYDMALPKQNPSAANDLLNASKIFQIVVNNLEYKIPRDASDLTVTTFHLNRFSIMGIYGGRKSGKSHLLRQLVGEDSFWFGDVFIRGHNLRSNTSAALTYLGYCPQKGGCFDNFTILTLLRLLLFETGWQTQSKIRNISRILKLENYMNIKFKQLPYNIKRKANIAVALFVGQPNKIVLLDEPTRGLPQEDRLLIWKIIRRSRAFGNTIIVATTDSKELEELSDFMIIMDKGEILDEGTPHWLRQKYRIGCTLEMVLIPEGSTFDEIELNLLQDISNINEFIMYLNDDSVLVNRKAQYLKYYVPIEKITYSLLCGSLEKNSQRLNIAEYTIHQDTLLMALEHLIKSKNNQET